MSAKLAFAGGLSLAIAAAAAPAPKMMAPPGLKSGSFSCDLRTKSGESIRVSGIMGNWRTKNDDLGTTDIDLGAPASSNLSGRYEATVGLGRVEMNQFGRGFTRGTMFASYGKEGMLMIESNPPAFNDKRSYIGFCDEHLSTQFAELPK